MWFTLGLLVVLIVLFRATRRARKETATSAASAAPWEVIPVEALGKCDRCVADAVRVWRRGLGLPVVLCEHHSRDHELTLVASGWRPVTPTGDPAGSTTTTPTR